MLGYNKFITESYKGLKVGDYVYVTPDESYTSMYPILSKFINESIGKYIYTNESIIFMVEYNITNNKQIIERLIDLKSIIEKGDKKYFHFNGGNNIKFHSSNYDDVKMYMVSKKYNL